MGDLAHAMQFGQGELYPENGWLHHLTHSLRYGVGLPLLLTGIAGAVVLAVRQPTTAALLFAFPVGVFHCRGQLRQRVLPLHDSDRSFFRRRGGVARDDGSGA